MPSPAEPARKTIRGVVVVETVPPLPTVTVFTVPTVGGTSGWKLTGIVPAYRGVVSQVFHPPGCHIQPRPAMKFQLP